jgi:hypothetical protein
MKRILFMSTICITQLYGMGGTRLLITPEKAAHALATSVLHPSCKGTPDQAIQAIKGFLQDDSLTSKPSLLVKDALIHILSAQVLERYQSLAPDEKNTTIIRTMFFDGTASIEQEKSFPPLDRSEPVTLHPKPRSPWYDLTFEHFIQSYCTARSSYAEKHK